MSMDGEFTGLETEKSVLAFNTSEEVYTKIQQNSKDFILIQLGLSLFRVSTDEPENADDDAPKTSKTSCKTYNFYVYPRNRSAWFSCQGESLSFLAQNGFDFNKLFAGGISYCSKAEENKLRADLLERQEARLDSIKGMVQQKAVNRIPVPENEVEMINGIE